MADAVLTVRHVKKYFGSVSALEDVSLAAYGGEVHAIVGDNGAGKSTLVKIITGIHAADDGEVILAGDHVGHRRGATHGAAVVYQDLALVECLDIATNLALGNLPKRYGILDRRRMVRDASQVLADLNVRVTDVTTPVGLLSGGQRQIIAIARAVRQDKPLLLLDEPTAALGVQETGHVGEIIEGIKPSGKAIVCISHDLEFVFAHADRITVLRLGRTVGTRSTEQTSRSEIVGMITGAIPGDRNEVAA